MKKKLNKLIADGRIGAILKILDRYIENEEFESELALISGRYNRLRKDKRVGILASKEARTELNDIANSITEFVNSLPHDLNLFNLLEKEFENADRQLNKRGKVANFFNFSDDDDEADEVKITFDSILKGSERLKKGRYNIAVIGKTGVGKSSLVNYIFNKEKDIVETGVGRPVTPKGFHKIEFEINGIPATLFDSWGLEIGKAEGWMRELHQELRGRDIDKPASEWFHTVIYCIAASGGRIEDFETNIINEFIRRRYNVVIVFTKSDVADEKDIAKLKSVIQSGVHSEISFCEICSVEKQLKYGGETKKFGSKDLYHIINQGFWDSITLRLPERCISIFLMIIDSWGREQRSFVRKFTNNFNIDLIYQQVEINSRNLIWSLESEQFMNIISNEVERTIQLYEIFSKMLDFHHLVKDKTFFLSVQKVAAFDYKKVKGNNMFWSAILVGLPLLLNMPRNTSIQHMEKIINDFCIDLQNDVFRLRPEIERILNKMLNSIE